MSLKVLSISGAATLQGPRLLGLRHFGVPYGGPWDRESHALANALVGSEPNALALELPMYGGLFAVESRLRVALAGAIGPVLVNGHAAQPNAAYTLKAGDRLEIGPYAQGSVAFLAVAGGWQGEAGASVVRENTLAAMASQEHFDEGVKRLDAPPSSLEGRSLRVIPGPQAHLLAPGPIHTEVLAERNRVGTRLAGEPPPDFAEIASEPACWGAIQITPKGELIVIGPDGPTIGGYPKIAVIVDADLDRVAQLREGDSMMLKAVGRDEAASLSAKAGKALQERLAMIRAAVGSP